MRPHLSWHKRAWQLRALALLVAAGLLALVQSLVGPGLAALEESLGDFAWRVGAKTQPERRVVVVDIDEASLQRVGAWPWSRSTLARLSERLDEAGVAVQAFDLVLDSPREGDAELADIWGRVPVVAGQVFSLTPLATPRVGEVAGALAAGACPPFAPRSEGYIANSPSLQASRLVVGHMTPAIEVDGVVRKVPAVICHDGQAYPSMALATLWRAAQPVVPGVNTAADWAWSDTGRPRLLGAASPQHVLISSALPGFEVPVDAHGQMRVPFGLDRRAFASVPAHKVLDGSADRSLLKGAIVLVGATGFGIVDTAATPLSEVAAGVEVHAQAVAGLLDQRVPFTPRGAPWLQLLAGAMGVSLLLVLAIRQPGDGAPVKRLPVAGLLVAVGMQLGASVMLVQGHVWLPWAAPALFVLFAATALAAAEHALTREQRARLSAHLGSYLPTPVAERLMAAEPTGTIQVEQREVSVLVADIRNFSAYAAHRPPQDTAALLHAFYCIAVDVVEQHGGVVENIAGDSMLAVWNAYSICPDHAQRALDAAKELVRATQAVLVRPRSATDDPTVQPLALGVGLESGKAIVGSFGPARRRSHAALGEPVSVASRLQGMTQELSVPVLLGPTMARRLPESGTEALGNYLLEGMRLHCTLYAPSDWAELVPSEQLWLPSMSGAAEGANEDSWAQRSDRSATSSLSRSPLRDA